MSAAPNAQPGSLGVRSLWRAWTRVGPRTAAIAVGLLTIQENLEHLASGQAAPGALILASPEYAGGLGITIAVGLVVGLVAALFAWRRQVLVATPPCRPAAARPSASPHRAREPGSHSSRRPTRSSGAVWRSGRRRPCEPRPSPSRARSPIGVHEGTAGSLPCTLVEANMLRRLCAAPSFAIAIASAFALASAAIIAPVTTAHSAQEAGDYTLEIGWLNEPPTSAAERRPGHDQDHHDMPVTDLGAGRHQGRVSTAGRTARS